jgi:chromosomal replication initiator protein
MEAWQQFLAQLNEELDPATVAKWVPKLVRFDAANIYLEQVDSFQLAWFEEHVRPRMHSLVNNNGRPIKVHFGEKKAAPPKSEAPPTLTIRPDSIDPEMTFENFVLSDQNLVVYKLLTELPPFNPIYIYGPQGAGKTHLLMATAQTLQKEGKRVFFVRAESFTEHVVQAIRLGQMQSFRKIYRDIDALIIDDIHVFAKKLATQEEFFHTFNTLHTSGRLVILSANTPPTQLHEMEERLISRFEWGISLDIAKAPSNLILQKKAELWNLQIENKAFSYLSEKFSSNPVMALQALAIRSKNAKITESLAKELLQDILEKEQSQALTFEKIIKIVAAHYGITGEDLLGKSQVKEFSQARQMAMYYCRERLKLPYQKIGELFGRDHSTVMSSVRQVQKNLAEKKTPEIGGLES